MMTCRDAYGRSFVNVDIEQDEQSAARRTIGAPRSFLGRGWKKIVVP
jgi:hypothetical protein